MKAQVSRNDGDIKVDITLNKEKVNEVVNEVAALMQPRAQLKGFRKGKAPLQVIKTHFKNEIMAEVSTRLVYFGTSEALKDNKLRNISNPTLLDEYRTTPTKPYLGKMHLDGSFSFSISVMPPPEVDVKDYTGVEIVVDAKDFNGWVRNKIKKQQFTMGEKSLVDRPIKLEDEVIVDFEGFVNSVPLDGGKEEQYRLVIGDNNLYPDFEKAFIGRSGNEEFSVDVQFPEKYSKAELSGQIVTFKCHIHEVYEVVPHELNDELAQLSGYNDTDDMMAGYKDMWESQFSDAVRAQTLIKVMDKIMENNPFNVPSAWIEQEMKNSLARFQMQDVTDETVLNSLREMSEKNVKIAYLLDKVYEKEESIHLGAEEFKELAEKQARKQGVNGDKLIEQLKQNGHYEGFVTSLEQQKAIDFLIRNAIVTEKE